MDREKESEAGGATLTAAEDKLRVQAVSDLRLKKRRTSPRML